MLSKQSVQSSRYTESEGLGGEMLPAEACGQEAMLTTRRCIVRSVMGKQAEVKVDVE